MTEPVNKHPEQEMKIESESLYMQSIFKVNILMHLLRSRRVELTDPGFRLEFNSYFASH